LKVIIKEVYRSLSKKDKICHEAFIFGELDNGIKLKIFDPDCIVPKRCKNQIIDCLLSATKSNTSSGISMKGKYLGKYIMPSEWLEIYNSLDEANLNSFHGIETQEGIFFIRPDDVKEKVGEIINFNISRFSIFAWCSIKK